MRIFNLLTIMFVLPTFLNAQNEANYFPFKSLNHKENYTLHSAAIDRANVLPEYYTHVVKYKTQNTMYMACYSQLRTTIDFIDLNLMEYAGALNLKELSGFDVETPILSYNIQGDKLIIFQGEKLSIVELDKFKGNLIESVDLNNDKGIFNSNTFHAELGFRPILDEDGSVYLMNLRYDVQIVDPTFYKGNNEVKINFNENKLNYEFLPVSYPKDYLKGYFGYYFMPRRVVDNKGNHIYSYSVSPTMQIWNSKSQEVSSATAKSYYQKDEIAFLDPTVKYSTKELMKYTVETGTYTSLLFDPYRNIYYRFFRPAIAEGIDCNDCTYQDKPLSILILDENLAIIDELYIGTTIYEEQTAFVGEEGLYLSCANTKNQHFGNGFISYDILGIQTIATDQKVVAPQLVIMDKEENSFLISGAWNTSQNAVITVFNLSGQIVFRDIYFNGKIITLPQIQKGIYMVQIADANNQVVLKWSN